MLYKFFNEKVRSAILEPEHHLFATPATASRFLFLQIVVASEH